MHWLKVTSSAVFRVIGTDQSETDYSRDDFGTQYGLDHPGDSEENNLGWWATYLTGVTDRAEVAKLLVRDTIDAVPETWVEYVPNKSASSFKRARGVA